MKRFYMFSIAVAAALTAAALPQQSQQSLMKRQADAIGIKPVFNLRDKAPRKVAPAKVEGEAAWGEWEMAGTGTFTLDSGFDDFMGAPEWTGDFEGINVYSRTDANDPSAMQYKFEGVYNNVDLIVDYDSASGSCKVYPQSTGIEYFDGSIMQVVDLATLFELHGEDWQGMTPEEVQEIVDYYSVYNYFIPDLGRFYLYLGYIIDGYEDLVCMTDTSFQLDGVEDMTVSVEAQTFYKDASDMKALVKFGESVAYCQYGCFSGILTQEKINAVIRGGNGIEQLEKASEIDLSSSDGNGMYCVVAITFSADGTPLEWDYAEYTYTSSSSEGWTAIGKGEYTSDMFEWLFDEDAQTYQVEVERNDLNPNIYRIVNPYGPSSPYYSDPYVDCVEGYDINLVLDTSNANAVTFKPTNLGVDYGGGWWIAVGTAYYMEDIQGSAANASMFGSLKDGVISFPAKSVLVTCEHMDALGGNPGSWYYGNGSGELSLTLPKGSAVEGVEMANEASAEFFNMQGVRISSPAKGSIVMERKGATVTKKVVR